MKIGEIEFEITTLPMHQLRSLVISLKNEIEDREEWERMK